MLIPLQGHVHLRSTIHMPGPPDDPSVSPLLNINAWHRDTSHTMSSHMKEEGQRTKEKASWRKWDHLRKNKNKNLKKKKLSVGFLGAS